MPQPNRFQSASSIITQSLVLVATIETISTSGSHVQLRQSSDNCLLENFLLMPAFRKNRLSVLGTLVNANAQDVMSGNHSLRNVAGILNRGKSAPPNVSLVS